ncbi:MAG TPA: type 4a pilus biogenesis protein PilO [Candidatus Xenobia bacterium]|nr:type 4a pilus biogenesis protein PilO [Candidatus Xenobia bacterium]
MALRDLPLGVQLVIGLVVAFAVVVTGWFYGPLADKKLEVENLQAQVQELQSVVAKLDDATKRHAELQTRIKAAEEQLERTKEVVPQEKQTDQFILMVQSSARTGGITLRRLTAKGTVYKDFYAEMPFEVELDGPYFSLVNFFRQLGQSSRIINAGGLKLDGVDPTKRTQREMAPGTTVAGTCVVTTFFTPSQAELAAAAPARPGAGAAPGRPGAAQPPRR